MKKQLLALAMAGAMLLGGCQPTYNENDPNYPGTTQPEQNDTHGDTENKDNQYDSDYGVTGDENLGNENNNVPTAAGVDVEKLAGLSTESKDWGPGGPKDEKNRSQGSLLYNKTYGQYDAIFLKEDSNEVYLTFDEGYEFGLSGQILDTLKEKGVKAIFFITGDFAKAEPELVQRMGYLADRMSVNLELPTAEGLRTLAPNKHRKNILTPMRQIQNGIHANKEELILYRKSPHFVSGGQSTQMIIGATPETDYQILNVAENLYQKFELKRVFYSAFVKVNEDKSLPALPGGPPLLREHRLYQADWLLRFYGFKAEELLDEKRPFFNVMLDPKEDWAVRHLECFPVEINRAPYADLLRVPGIGVKSARRILSARRSTKLTFQDLKKLGVVMKRAVYFITCGGRMMYPTKLEEDYIVRNLTDPKERIRFGSDGMSYRQMTLFDDGMFPNGVRQEEKLII